MVDTPGGGSSGSDGRTTPGHGDMMLVATEQGLKDIEPAVSQTSMAALSKFIADVQETTREVPSGCTYATIIPRGLPGAHCARPQAPPGLWWY